MFMIPQGSFKLMGLRMTFLLGFGRHYPTLTIVIINQQLNVCNMLMFVCLALYYY